MFGHAEIGHVSLGDVLKPLPAVQRRPVDRLAGGRVQIVTGRQAPTDLTAKRVQNQIRVDGIGHFAETSGTVL